MKNLFPRAVVFKVKDEREWRKNMTIPEHTIIGLSLLVLILIGVRIWLQIRFGNKAPKRKSEWDIGVSKTIGDREIQEDEYGICETEDGLMAIVADGMGKHFGGKIASRIVVETFQEIFQDRSSFYNTQYSFRKAFQGANREILNKMENGQGTASAAAVMIKDRRLYYAVVGNVQVAVYRKQELVPVSSGHTVHMLAKQKYEEGKLTKQEAVSLLGQHRLYNFIGQDGFHNIEFFDTPIQLYGGEYVVVMTDGLYETARWKDMEDCLEEEGSCQKKAFGLVELVNRSMEEDRDNAAVVVVRC